ncbi:MAG: glycosyltransferase family 39 protein [Chloroflexi bacterium]|nr:glycosyltransferase family 39 protein [Chloroflexota bacterium]
MTSQIPKKTSEVFACLWPWFFFAAAFESLLFAGMLFSVPSESGLSLARFALLAILLLAFVASIIFGLRARHDTVSLDLLPRTPLVISSTLLSLTSSLVLFLLRYLNPERLLPVYERLSPLLWFFLVFGIQSAIFLLILQNGFHPQELTKRKPIYVSAGFAFIALLLVFLFVSLTKLGITKDTAYWGEPGVAILGWHFILAIILGFFTLLNQLRFTNHESSRLFNIFLPLAIWLTASILWLSVPWEVLQNSFYAPITPPANTPLPYSDAGFYDYLSQSLLIGTDYLGGIPPRPLYIVFLAFLHAFFGQNYIAIIAAQTLVLALFPVALYFLAKKLHTPAAGVTVALFAIFREYLGLWISSNTRVANSKVFTTDFPTAVGLAFICLIVIWWLEKRDLKSTLIAGGSFGLLLLLRTQSLLILPVVFILAWFVYKRQTKQWIAAGIAFALAMSLTIAPWLAHNYTVTGKIAFDDPNQMAIIFSQYSFNETFDLTQFDIHSESLGRHMLDFALQNPGYVAGFITGHFLNTEIGGLLALPLIERYDGLFAPVNLYWVGWPAPLAWYNLLLLVFYLAIIAVGLGAARHRAGWLGLVPLAFNLGYAFANGISRFSSWRYNLPVDWVVYFYSAIGAMEILGGLALLLGAKDEDVIAPPKCGGIPRRVFFPTKQSPVKEQRFLDEIYPFNGRLLRQLAARSDILILAAFALVGALPWFAKGLVSPRYTSTQQELTAQVISRGYETSEVEVFLAQPDAILLDGRMLYPRLYRRDDGMVSANPWPAYAVRDYARIGFVLINDDNYDAIFPTRDVLDFPQGADAILLACQREDYLDVRVVVFSDAIYQSAPLTDLCK